jgi:hypothetical protein
MSALGQQQTLSPALPQVRSALRTDISERDHVDCGPQAEVAHPQHRSKQIEAPDQQARRKGPKPQGAD